MYAKYLKEREGSEIVEKVEGFMVLKFLEDSVYLQDIYVLPEFRKQGMGRKMLEELEILARDAGFSSIVGSCCPTANGSTESLKAILACGFKLRNCEKDIIFLVKDI